MVIIEGLIYEMVDTEIINQRPGPLAVLCTALCIKERKMSDEGNYLQATNEVEGGKPIPALWAKALALVEGDSVKAKYQYIQLRVAQLKKTELASPSNPYSSKVHEIKHTVPDESDQSNINPIHARNTEVGFSWWQIWAWLGLTLGNLYMVVTLFHEMVGLATILIIMNSILMVMILRFNKYAFLVATILSLNPIVWIVNGIYLKNRWNHPKVNGEPGEDSVADNKHKKGHKGFCEKCGAKTTINYGDAYHTLCERCA